MGLLVSVVLVEEIDELFSAFNLAAIWGKDKPFLFKLVILINLSTHQ